VDILVYFVKRRKVLEGNLNEESLWEKA